MNFLIRREIELLNTMSYTAQEAMDTFVRNVSLLLSITTFIEPIAYLVLLGFVVRFSLL